MAFKNPFRRSGKDKTSMENEQLNTEQVNDPATGTHTNTETGPATADMAAEVEPSEAEMLKGELNALRTEHSALHDKHVRLFAEFDNFRKRTAKERLDLLQTAGASTLKSILPVLDDMERAVTNNVRVEDVDTVKQGLELIHQKFVNLLMVQGLKVMDAKGATFDPELHEAITKAPAPTPDLIGKVVDVIENGYFLNDKVMRYAKVVVGE